MSECKHERYSSNVIGFEVMQKSECVCGDCGIEWESLATRKPQKEVAQSSATHNTAHSEISLFELVGNYHTMSYNEFTEWMGANIGELEKIARQQNA